jgi:aminoglycoside phosphotransferase (APT) family kinase protein
VRATLQTQIPGLDVASLRPLGSGWDYDAWLVGEQWVFRFPRRAEVAEILPREIAWTARVSEGLAGAPLAVPRFDHTGEPGPDFPYPFVGYRMLRGEPGYDVPAASIDRAQVASALGETLRLLHALPAAPFEQIGTFPESAEQAAWMAAVVRDRDSIRPNVPEEVLSEAEPFLEGTATPAPERDAPHLVIHNDLGADHVLVDPDTGRATAILDFGDLCLGDPANDFVGLPAWLGWGFLRDVLSAYGAPPDAAFLDRIAFLARACTLLWLGEASRTPEHSRAADLQKHRDWVRRTFDPES